MPPFPPRLQQVRTCLQQALTRARLLGEASVSTAPVGGAPSRWGVESPRLEPPATDLRGAIAPHLARLETLYAKLDQTLVRIAVFGLVSRGKSALINALVGEQRLVTGPLHGVTQTVQAVRWEVPSLPFPVELVDTPGLEEVDGLERAALARQIAQQSDLILFVVEGDITRREYQALGELAQAQKPLIVVFNKIDLHPDLDRRAIAQRLQDWLSPSGRRPPLQSSLQSRDRRQDDVVNSIVMVAAAPAPVRVETQWPDGRVTEELETPPPQIEELQTRLLRVLRREGIQLLALNTLVQVRAEEQAIARRSLSLLQPEAEALIWRYARYKALAIALNPVVVVDMLGGMFADLALIRALARLYHLPMTSYQASRLLSKILWSSGGLLLGEWGGALMFGMGKSAAAAGLADNSADWTGYGGAAIAQAAIAGYGTYIVGRAAQVYLERGCSWGELGPSQLIRGILAGVERGSVLMRLRQELLG